MAPNPAARGLMDDAAIVELGDATLILTHDMMVQGVHWMATADPADVAWKLVSVNLSDLAAKGAKPAGLLLGYMLGDDDWDRQFAAGLDAVLRHYNVPLLGGDTVSSAPLDIMQPAENRSIGMTAIGTATHKPVPSRSGAQIGDSLYVTGTLGDAFAGFEAAKADIPADKALQAAFHRPVARLDDGRALAPIVSAMMDISDGLLIDADRMARASGLALSINMALLPLSAEYIAHRGDAIESRIAAASWGDDYQLLFAAKPGTEIPVSATKIGKFSGGQGVGLHDDGTAVNLPVSLGFEHG